MIVAPDISGAQPKGSRMRKLLMTAAVAIAVSLAAGPANAATGITLSPNTTLTIRNLTLTGPLGIDIICNVTMDAAFHVGTGKRTGQLAAFADIAVSTNACSEGNAGILVGGARVTGAQGPFHVTYVSFTGTLPNIASVTLQVNDVTFWVTLGSLSCLTAGAIDISGTTTGGNPARGMDVSARSIALAGGGLCTFATGTMNGSGSLSAVVTMSLF